MKNIELIDKAIDDLRGEFKPAGNYVVIDESTLAIAHIKANLQPICTRAEFLTRKAERQNKPDWKDVLEKHPKAQYLAQWSGCDGDNKGLWISYETKPDCENGYVVECPDGASTVYHHSAGQIIGRWQDTLEQRPAVTESPALNIKFYAGKISFFETLPGGEQREFMTVGGEKAVTKSQDALKNAGIPDREAEIHNRYAEWAEAVRVRYVTPQAPEFNHGAGALNVAGDGWHARGDLPPIGAKCLCWFDDGRECWHECFVIGSMDSEIKNRYLAVSLIGKHERKLVWANEFRPLRTEREKFIDAVMSLSDRKDVKSPKDLAGVLYGAGFRQPDTKA